ncbi:DUF4865 family protein [Thalassospira alkalitolerans]|uniref:DUF4865 family protein n=1 Tax=Thalassospira alkalitolerans TaxID=1293890 RepID=UPI003AA8970B
MIAMQYSFTLPADYDMSIIDRRITDKGPLLDGFPHLKFKVYLVARQSGDDTASAENLYAPFYIWDHPAGINNFLCGSGFAGLAQSFGRPSAKTWIVWMTELAADFTTARFASRNTTPIAPHADLETLRHVNSKPSPTPDTQNNLAGIVTGFDPTNWTQVDFRLWYNRPDTNAIGTAQLYTIGHMSTGRTTHTDQKTTI